jgi:hypothetical protein
MIETFCPGQFLARWLTPMASDRSSPTDLGHLPQQNNPVIHGTMAGLVMTNTWIRWAAKPRRLPLVILFAQPPSCIFRRRPCTLTLGKGSFNLKTIRRVAFSAPTDIDSALGRSLSEL